MPDVQKTEKSVGAKVLRGGVIVAVASILVRLSGYIYRYIFQSVYSGEDLAVFRDSHFYVVGIVTLLVNMTLQTVAPAFLPVFMQEGADGDKKDKWRFASAVTAILLSLSLLLAIVSMVWPEFLVDLNQLITQKEPSAGGVKFLSLHLFYAAPGILAISIAGLTSMILNSQKKFFWAQAADGVMRLTFVVAILYSYLAKLSIEHSVRVIGLGVALGCFLRLGTHLIAMGADVKKLFTWPKFNSKQMRMFFWLILPLIAGSLFSQVRDFLNNFALLTEEGMVTANGNGRTIFTAMTNLIPWALGVAMFPYFCELVDKNNMRELGKILTRSGRVLGLFFFAFAGAIFVMSKPLMFLAYGHIADITLNSLNLSAVSNMFYIIVLPAYALEKLVMQGFFSNRKMVAPIVLGAVFSVFSIVISIIAMRGFALEGASLIAAIALGYTISRYLKTTALIITLKKTVPMFEARATFTFLWRSAVVALVAGGGAFLARSIFESRYPLDALLGLGRKRILMQVGLEFVVVGAVSISLTVLAIKLLKMEELSWVMEWYRGRKNKKPQDTASSISEE